MCEGVYLFAVQKMSPSIYPEQTQHIVSKKMNAIINLFLQKKNELKYCISFPILQSCHIPLLIFIKENRLS